LIATVSGWPSYCCHGTDDGPMMARYGSRKLLSL
jgi:hypothetical protein